MFQKTTLFLLILLLSSCNIFTEKSEEIMPEENTSLQEVDNITDIVPQELSLEEINDIEKKFGIVEVFMEKEEYEKALGILLPLSEKYPQNHRVLSRLWKLYMKQMKYDEALNIFLRTSDVVFDQNTNILYNIAVVYRNIGDMNNAKIYIQKILKLDPKHEKALTFDMQERAKGEQWESYPWESYENLWIVQMKERDYEWALENFEKAYEMWWQENPRLIKSIGIAHHNLTHTWRSSYDEAEKWLQEAIEKDPKNQNLQNVLLHNTESREIDQRLSEIYPLITENTDKSLAKAKELIDSGLEKFPTDAGLLSALGRYYFNKKNFSEAKTYFEMANKNTGGDDEYLLYLLWTTMRNLGDEKKSKEYIDQALEINPELNFKSVSKNLNL